MSFGKARKGPEGEKKVPHKELMPHKEPICLEEMNDLAKTLCEEVNPNYSALEGLRSTDAFLEAADKIDLDGRKLTLLYPASGSHIAPLFLISKLMDEDRIDAGELIYSEISPASLGGLQERLIHLAEKKTDYKILDIKLEEVGEGNEQSYCFRLLYKNKPITFTFRFKAGEDGLWFKRQDGKDSQLFIIHDPDNLGYAIVKVKLAYQYFQSLEGESDSSPRMIMVDDLTRSERPFDLELLGHFERIDESYGHRDQIANPQVEVGPSYETAVLLNPHPEIAWLNKDEQKALIEANIISNWKTSSWDEFRSHLLLNMPGVTTELVMKPENYRNIIKSMPEVLKTLAKINPILARGMAVRLLRMFYGFEEFQGFFILKSFDDPLENFKAHTLLLGEMEKYLSDKDTKVLRKHLEYWKKYFAAIPSIQDQLSRAQELEKQKEKTDEEYEELRKLNESTGKSLHRRLASRKEMDFLKDYGNKIFETL